MNEWFTKYWHALNYMEEWWLLLTLRSEDSDLSGILFLFCFVFIRFSYLFVDMH